MGCKCLGIVVKDWAKEKNIDGVTWGYEHTPSIIALYWPGVEQWYMYL